LTPIALCTRQSKLRHKNSPLARLGCDLEQETGYVYLKNCTPVDRIALSRVRQPQTRPTVLALVSPPAFCVAVAAELQLEAA
jgi:hypothetical protein